MIETICLKCPSGHPVVTALFDTAKLEYKYAVQAVPIILIQQGIKNTCPQCGQPAVQTGIESLNHRVTQHANFLDAPIKAAPHVDLNNITILLLANKDGQPWVMAMQLLANIPAPENPAAN